jgi:hypothetical protein
MDKFACKFTKEKTIFSNLIQIENNHKNWVKFKNHQN